VPGDLRCSRSPRFLHRTDNRPVAVAGQGRWAARSRAEALLQAQEGFHALVPPEESDTHSGDDVGVYAQGPWARRFDRVIEQNATYLVIAHAIGLPDEAALATPSN
jgi:alkaline phosphatase